jgi:hypoxanthine phosphoribosyltransferase
VSLSSEKAQQVLDAAELIVPAPAVAAAVARVAREISEKLADEFPLVLCVMRGGVIFAGQLLLQLRFPLEVDYLEITRYRSATVGGAIDWKVAPGTGVAGRIVLVLDDILDEGKTLAAIRDRVQAAGARGFYSVVFAEKDTGREKPIHADFVGVRVPNRYVFGFGMDIGGLWRNLPGIYALKEQ